MADTGTVILRAAQSFSVQLPIKEGCGRLTGADGNTTPAPYCETRHLKAAADGLWVHQLVRRFTNGDSRLLRRAVEEPRLEDLTLWEYAQNRIKWAWNISNWAMGYMEKAKQPNRLMLRKIETSIGVMDIIPQCDKWRLLGIIAIFPNHDLKVEYSNREDIAPFEFQLCSGAVLVATK